MSRVDGPLNNTPNSTDVVVIGAGLAGLTAAYELRDRDVIVLEARDRVGGRTLSGNHGDYWFNSGAQFVWDHRTVALCRRLGVEVLDAHGAEASLFLRGRLARGRNPYMMFMRLPLSLRERWDLGTTITRLRRLAAKMNRIDSQAIDAGSLADLLGDVQPVTRAVMDMVSETGTGLSASEVSGWIGLGYSIHLFGGDVNDTLKQVVGGTQMLPRALARAVGEQRIRMGHTVRSVENDGDGVTVRFATDEGSNDEIRARACVMAATADAVLETVVGLTDAKRAALERVVPYGRIVSVAWLTDEQEPMPWDKLLVTPVVGDHSFEQISNNAFFAKQVRSPSPGGCLVTLATGARADRLWELDDGAVRERQLADLRQIYPSSAASTLVRAATRVKRWHGFPLFLSGWLACQAALREPLGNIHFCGDYTAQPGTPGAVGSGYYAAQAARRSLGAAALASVDGGESQAAGVGDGDAARP